MRAIAIILNIILFMIFIPLVVHKPREQWSENPFSFYACILACVTPICSIWIIAFVPRSASKLYLYLRRKSAEDRKRIAELESETDSQ